MINKNPTFPSQKSASVSDPVRKPAWLRRPMAHQGKQNRIREHIKCNEVHTVCNEARCPNRGECFAHGTATFLVMGAICTRKCAFCSVGKGVASPLDWNEINRVIEATESMGLQHLVVTSVTRDDLPDGGGAFFAELVRTVRRKLPGVTIELLIPDMQGDSEALSMVFQSRPDVLNHNVETIPALYASVRPQADYQRSLRVLGMASEAGLLTKSGLMVGLGEEDTAVLSVLDDLASAGCKIVTIGQYLRPTPEQIAVQNYVSPEVFRKYASEGKKRGLLVVAAPFVRSSYNALKTMEECVSNMHDL